MKSSHFVYEDTKESIQNSKILCVVNSFATLYEYTGMYSNYIKQVKQKNGNVTSLNEGCHK